MFKTVELVPEDVAKAVAEKFNPNTFFPSNSFHINWGWHETNPFNNDYNGWYGFNNWNISERNWNYQYSRGAVPEIHL